MAGPDYIVEIDGLRDAHGAPPTKSAFRGRPWLAVTWKCCSAYSRIYRNADGSAYEGRCPRCMRPVHARIGPGGTRARFFEAG